MQDIGDERCRAHFTGDADYTLVRDAMQRVLESAPAALTSTLRLRVDDYLASLEGDGWTRTQARLDVAEVIAQTILDE
jgi:hypothetical protein